MVYPFLYVQFSIPFFTQSYYPSVMHLGISIKSRYLIFFVLMIKCTSVGWRGIGITDRHLSQFLYLYAPDKNLGGRNLLFGYLTNLTYGRLGDMSIISTCVSFNVLIMIVGLGEIQCSSESISERVYMDYGGNSVD